MITVYSVNANDRRAGPGSGSTPVTPELLFHRHYRDLVGALAVACGSRERASDAVREAFVELCKRWNKISRYEKPEAWLMHVAVNKLRSEQRSLRRRAAVLLRLQEQYNETAPGGPPQVAAAFQALPSRQRLACCLFYLLDLSLEEVGEAMGISTGAVSAHLNRARTTLRPMLEEQS